MKFALLAAAAIALGACSTGQIASSKYSCGGTSHLTAEFVSTADGAEPELKSVNVCTGTNGTEREFKYDLYSKSGKKLKSISYGATTTEATSALIVVGEVLKATSSNDAVVASAAIAALPSVLASFMRIAVPAAIHVAAP